MNYYNNFVPEKLHTTKFNTICLLFMEIRQLRYFIAVAETSSFSEASRRCFLSQSAISQQIRLLETELNTILFIRNSHNVKLSESGEEFLPMARKALMSFEECFDHMKNRGSVLQGQLNIGVGPFYEPYFRQASVSMMKAYPDLRLNLVYSSTSELHRRLVCHELDIAFSVNMSKAGENIDSVPAMSFHFRAIMRKDHPLAGKDMLTCDDLVNYGAVLPEMGERIFATIKKNTGFDFNRLDIRAVVNDSNAALNLIRDTEYITLLPARAVHGYPGLVSKPIKCMQEPIQCYAHRMTDVCKKKGAEVFLSFLNENAYAYNDSVIE